MRLHEWLAATASKEFTIRAGLAAVRQFEDENGAFTPEEVAEADAWVTQAIAALGSAKAKRQSA